MFPDSEKYNYTILKLETFMYYQVLNYVNTSLDGHVDNTCTYVYWYFATYIFKVFCLKCAIYILLSLYMIV